MAELPPLPDGFVVNHFITSDNVERSARPGRSVPDAAEAAPVRDPLLRP